MNDIKHIGKEINIVSNKIRRKIDNEVAKYGITGAQAKIIGFVYIESKKKSVFQKDIENDLKIRSSSVTSVLQLMEKNGYIKRESVFEDGRLKKIILTEKGDEIRIKVRDIINEIEARVEQSMTDEEMEFFFHILNKVSKRLSD
ncbi:MAG: MarR family transcriptional regulator [Clostridium butyricum]|nr:MarR family transcriptional regulator [Clostridium butyricum]